MKGCVGCLGAGAFFSRLSLDQRFNVVLPSEGDQIICLRSLSGSESVIHRAIERRASAPCRIRTAEPAAVRGPDRGKPLPNAVRLGLRSGAGPFRSLGWLSVRPPSLPIVPLIMALRLGPKL